MNNHSTTIDKAAVDPYAESFLKFMARIDAQVRSHPVIVHNPYTEWFKKGTFSKQQAREFLVQFSVFSNEFLFAQMRKMVNANSIAEMRASKEILANELGVTFNDGKDHRVDDTGLGGLSGSINGGVFRFKAAHFELLARLAEQLGLEFGELGKRQQATPTTLYFCDELLRLYGSEDYAIATAASFAVENWAAAGFWDELVAGWQDFNNRNRTSLPIGFFTWHARVEANHAQHTTQELAEYYLSHRVDEDLFIDSANEMLAGVHQFWNGLFQSVND